MARPGTKITSFPPVPPPTTPLPGALSTLPAALPPALPAASEGHYPPESEEPITFPDDITIDELVELRTIIPTSDKRFWCAGDLIWVKRDAMYEVHFKSQYRAFQNNTIAQYTVNKMQVPETVGQPFEDD